MDVWTIQLGQWRLAQAQGIELLNVTLGSGNHAFAPTPEQLQAYRAGQMSELEYRERYIQQMRQTFVQQRHEWDKLKGYSRLAVACYCAPDKFCHRHIFTELLTAFLHREGISVSLQGELRK